MKGKPRNFTRNVTAGSLVSTEKLVSISEIIGVRLQRKDHKSLQAGTLHSIKSNGHAILNVLIFHSFRL
jgi:hypothetical protein